MSVTDEVRALIQAYSDGSNPAYTGEGSVAAAAACCVVPYNNFTMGAHTNPRTVEALTHNGDWYAGIFRDYGVRSRTVKQIEVIEVSPLFAIALADWECADEDGKTMLSFKICHGVRKTPEGWRQEFAIHDNETLAAMEAFPGFVETIQKRAAEVQS